MESCSRKKVIGFVCTSDPIRNREAWSGTPYKMREAIENAGYEVKWIKVQPNKILFKLIRFLFRRLLRIHHMELSGFYGWLRARSASMDDIRKCDFLLIYFDWRLIKYLQSRASKLPPFIYYSDTSYRLMLDYYWFNIPQWINHQTDALENYATNESALVVKSSEWARESAVCDYGCPKEKTAVLEFGANLDEDDIVETEPYKAGTLHILCLAVEWKRKGCDIAIETVKLLNEDGIMAKLFLVGLDKINIPSEYQNLEFVEYVGYLNKNQPHQYKKLIEVISNSHCLLLPTQAECSAIVFCEAAAFGLPSFTYDTGGLGNYVINGETGYRLNMNSSAEDFAHVIKRTVINNEFERLHRGALDLYNEKLNWGVWSQRFADMMESKTCFLK